MEPLSRRVSTATQQIYRQNESVISRYGRWFLVAWLAALVDGKILVAIAISLLTYRFVLSGSQLPWDKVEEAYQRCLRQFSKIGQSPLLMSSLAFGTTYWFAAAWSQLGGGWAALTLLGLGVGNGLFLLREISGRDTLPSPSSETFETLVESPEETYWQNLSATNPLKRLIAVRSLLHETLSSEDPQVPYLPGTQVSQRSHLVDCFRLMLVRETEPLVRVALIEGLKALQPKPQLPKGQPAMQPLKPQTSSQGQRIVEYIEIEG